MSNFSVGDFFKKVYNHFQIDSMKRLIILSFLAEPSLKQLISNVISNNKKLLLINPLEVYLEIKNLYNVFIF